VGANRARKGKPWIQTSPHLRATAPVLDPTIVKIDIIRCHVAKGLMIALAVVVLDKNRDLALKFFGGFPHDQINPFLHER
jgi:hypothetical protein